MSKSADAFRTISEVAEWLDTPAHVLRFWESKFTQVKPVKRAGGRRYYRPQDMMLLGGIKKLLHDDGMTIKHVQKLLRQEGVKHVAAMSANPADGGRYTAVEPVAKAEPDESSVVSFRQDAEPVVEELEAETPSSSPSTEGGTLPFPGFLSGGSDMSEAAQTSAAEKEPESTQDEHDDEPEIATPIAEDPVLEDTPSPAPSIDIMGQFAGRSLSDLRSRTHELRPIMDRLRDQIARMS